MTVFVIIGVVALVAVGGLILLLAAKNNVTVVDAPRPRSPPGVVVPPPGSAHSVAGNGPVQDLLRSGQKIEAIKRYRELTGVGLKEAKDAVEAMERGEEVPVARAPAVSAPAASVQDLLRSGRKIEAIKLYREQSGLGLKEAKDAVEAMERGDPPPLRTPKRTITSEMAVDDAELRGHVTGGRILEAIKRYRELTGLGLKESKDAIESLRDSLKS